MKVTLWGTRGSLACAGPETIGYGGDTSTVEVETGDGALVLDAGTGVRSLGDALLGARRVDLLLTHLHMDHIQGLGFFRPLLDPDTEVHLWGPASGTLSLAQRLARYLSPPLFPLRVRELESVVFHDVGPGSFSIGSLTVSADLLSHPGLTLGYRIEAGAAVLAYLPDHEPALGNPRFPGAAEWTSGSRLAQGASLLIHDAQYTSQEYEERMGWGHSAFEHVLAFAELSGVEALVPFHHDPWHSDQMLDELMAASRSRALGFELIPGKVRTTIELEESRGREVHP
ncbi:MAG: MBL fold metallo-hydrolase [Actinomycetota bacterium]|nr:MBL fold metallo-hydrolase [Actinomycetota bacterium]